MPSDPALQSTAVALPTWHECNDKMAARKPMTALERFILSHEPQGEEAEFGFRTMLAAVVREAADARR